MEDSWRFRPIQGNICPTCSTCHFPFCSQPLPFDRNGFVGVGGLHRIPNDPSFHRPLFDPFSDNPIMPRPSLHYDDHRVNSIPSMYGNPIDGYGKPRSWNRNSNLDRDPLNQFPQPPLPMPDSSVFNRDGYDYGSNNRFTRGEFSESDRIHKRMKIDEMGSGSGSFTPVGSGDYPSNPKQISVEDERRLNLIREHGGPTSGVQSHGGLDSSFRSANVHGGGNLVNASYLHDGSLRPPSNKGTNSFQDSGIEQSSAFGHQQISNVDHSVFRNNSQQHQYSDYGNNSLHPSLHGHGPSKVQTGAPSFVNNTQQCQDSSVIDRSFSNSHQPILPHHSPYPITHEEHHTHDFQQLQSKDFDRHKDSQYPHVSNRQVSSGYHGQQSDLKHSFEVRPPPLPGVEQFGSPNLSRQGSYLPISTGNGMNLTRQGQIPSAQPFSVHPPLPPMPPPPFPMEPAGPPPSRMQAISSAQNPSSSFYPIPAGSSVSLPLLHQSTRETQSFPLKHPSPDKPKVINASHLIRRPHRASRPDHIVIILRGLPGSGKSYLAKMLRDLEVENGGDAPRIHSMDDYFMTEVEKVEEREGSKTSNSVKGRKQIIKKVMEYCYEPEMEEAYRSSMLKAFKKNLEEGSFTFIIVDDRNLRVADFAQFWASAKRSGYEVYLLEAAYKDPVGCAARNVHGFTSDDIKKMAELWEEAPSLYLQLDVQSLFHGDGMDETGIQEVDMDTEDDVACGEDSSELHDANSLQTREQPIEDYALDGSFKDEERWDAEGEDLTGVKELGRSKWSQDVDEEDTERREGAKRSSSALSGLIQAYAKGDKSVHWGDQVGKTGFSIGAAKKANLLSLVIGPGAGYNLKSNPLLEKESVSKAAESSWESNKRSVFQEHLRAERESFKAVFDRRRHRIGGLEAEDE